MSMLFAQLVADATPAAPAAGMRSAALALHAMHQHDRAWTLSQLTQPQRATLQPLLEELQALQLPAEPRLIGDALQASASPDAAEPATPGDKLLDRCAAASTQVMAELLMTEPPALVERVLGLHDWPWRAEVRALLAVHRSDVADGPDIVGRRPWIELDRCVMARLMARLGSEAPAPVAPAHEEHAAAWQRGWQQVCAILRRGAAR